MKNVLNLACILLTSLLLFSCESSLDLDTERIETRIPAEEVEPVFKVSNLSVETSVTGFIPQGPTAWNYSVQAESFSADMTTTPPTFSMDYQLQQLPGGSGSTFSLENLRIRLEDATPTGNDIAISGDPNVGPGIFASGEMTVGGPPAIAFTTDPSATGPVSYTATGNYNYSESSSPAEFTGTVTVSMQLPQNTRATLAISFTAVEQ